MVARLRRHLGPGALDTTGTGNRLVGSTDAELFSALVAEARSAGRQDLAGATTALRSGLALWRGDTAYDGVRDDLVAPERHRLHAPRRCSGTAGSTARRFPDPKASEDANLLLSGLLARDPLRESAHELSMLAAWRAGRQADALAAYTRLQRLLREELGIDPGPSAVALHARILVYDPTLPTSGEPARPPRRRSAPPAPATPMIRREVDLARVEELRRVRRLVLITGPAGVGKPAAGCGRPSGDRLRARRPSWIWATSTGRSLRLSRRHWRACSTFDPARSPWSP